ncbi:hypothetical protein [Acidianus brierleyi]|uniref:AAA domain-containing protein n=1 Tax=Acidianus brierleyi TaxID=41673 RepID=A0A2U9ICK2_9CREN|nr:hypothetical protein [Acidianus brierleyi]AWR93746.1 hypothetical protein DFR85_03070 [Acidianus brierleyi]
MLKITTSEKTYTLNDCNVFYGYDNLSDLINSLSILDPTGYLKERRKIAWTAYFHISREYSDEIRKMYFTIFEIASIVREMNFRYINMAYALPSIISNVNTSIQLSWRDNKISLKTPIHIELESNLVEEIKKDINVKINDKEITVTENDREIKNSFDLYQITGVRDFYIISRFRYNSGKIVIDIDLEFYPSNKGINREISIEELNRVLRVTAKEVNEKSIGSHSEFEEFMISIVESLIEPLIIGVRENVSELLGLKEMVYIPPSKPFMLNAEESALNAQEVAQIFLDKCEMAINRIRSGKLNFSENEYTSYLPGLKIEGGLIEYNGKSIAISPYNIKALATIILELSSIKENAIVFLEAPEEYIIDEDRRMILNILDTVLKNGNKIIVHTWSRSMKEMLESLCKENRYL